MIFSHIYTYDTLHFRTVYSLDAKEKRSLDKIVSSLGKIKNINTHQLEANIFLEKNDILFKLSLVPGMQLLNFGSAVTIGKNIFIPNVDIKHNQFILQGDKSSGDIEPLFSDILAHELVHIWQNKRYGSSPVANLFQKPKWVIEGYAVYSAEKARVLDKPRAKIKNFLKKHNTQSGHIRNKGAYILWGLMIQHAIEHMHKSVDDLHLGKVSYDEVMESLLKEYNISKE